MFLNYSSTNCLVLLTSKETTPSTSGSVHGMGITLNVAGLPELIFPDLVFPDLVQ